MKPVVHYRKNANTLIGGPGTRAIVRPIDHPNHVFGQSISNTRDVITSPIVALFEDGVFETRNTRYVPDA